MSTGPSGVGIRYATITPCQLKLGKETNFSFFLIEINAAEPDININSPPKPLQIILLEVHTCNASVGIGHFLKFC